MWCQNTSWAVFLQFFAIGENIILFIICNISHSKNVFPNRTPTYRTPSRLFFSPQTQVYLPQPNHSNEDSIQSHQMLKDTLEVIRKTPLSLSPNLLPFTAVMTWCIVCFVFPVVTVNVFTIIPGAPSKMVANSTNFAFPVGNHVVFYYRITAGNNDYRITTDYQLPDRFPVAVMVGTFPLPRNLYSGPLAV